MQAGCEGFQAFEEREHHHPHTQWGLLPILNRDAEPLWKRGGINQVAHDANLL